VGGSDVDELFVGFWSRPNSNEVLLLSELVVRETELQHVQYILAQRGFTVSAVHNHWLLDEPRLYYVHIQAVGQAVSMARAFAAVWMSLM